MGYKVKQIVLLNATQIEPPVEWITSSLMFADKIGTLTLPGATPAFKELKTAGLWEKADIMQIDGENANRIVSEAEALCQELPSHSEQRPTSKSSTESFIFKKKLPSDFQYRLSNSPLVKDTYDKNGEYVYAGSTVFIDTVLNLAGRHITSEYQDDGWCLAVNSQREVTVNLEPFPQDSASTDISSLGAENQISTGLQIGVPMPTFGKDISIAEIIELRSKHEAAFRNFRSAADALAAGDLAESSEEYLDRYMEAVRKLQEVKSQRGGAIKLETQYVIRSLDISGRYKALKDPTAWVGMSGSAIGGYSSVQGIAGLDTIGILGAGAALIAMVVRVRKASPTSWIKELSS